MVKNIDNNFDRLIEEALEEEFDNITCPPKEEAWEQVISRLRKHRRNELLKRLRPILVAGIFICFLSGLLASFQKPVLSFADKVIKSIEKLTNSSLTINKSIDNSTKDIPEVENNSYNNPMIIDAQNKVSFKLQIPKYIPEGYKLSKVDVSSENKEQETVTFLYYDLSGENKSNFMQIMQICMSNSTKISMNIKTDEETKIKHIKMDGTEYTVVNNDQNFNKILWDRGNVSYKIDATVEEGVIIEIAKSMK